MTLKKDFNILSISINSSVNHLRFEEFNDLIDTKEKSIIL